MRYRSQNEKFLAKVPTNDVNLTTIFKVRSTNILSLSKMTMDCSVDTYPSTNRQCETSRILTKRRLFPFANARSSGNPFAPNTTYFTGFFSNLIPYQLQLVNAMIKWFENAIANIQRWCNHSGSLNSHPNRLISKVISILSDHSGS